MFANKTTVVFITKSKIKITSVENAKKPKETILFESNWSLDNLAQILEKSKKLIGTSPRLLLSEDFVYIVSFTLNPTENPVQNIIKQKAQELIPEDLNETIWDYKEIGDKKYIAASCIKRLFDPLKEILIKSKITFDLIQPLSYSFTRLNQKDVNPLLFVYLYDKVYLTFLEHEAIIATYSFSLPLVKENLKKIIENVAEKNNVTPKRIIIFGNTDNINLKDFELDKMKSEIQNLSPSISLGIQEDFKDKDKKVLNLQFIKVSDQSNTSVLNGSSQTTVNPKRYVFLKSKIWKIAIALTAVIIAVEIILLFKTNFRF